MGRYVLRRVLLLAVVMFVVSTVVFFVFRILPGDLASIRLGIDATPEAIERLREQLGLNRPIWMQYLEWVSKAIRGDLGVSWVNKQPVLDLVLEKTPATAELACLSVGFGFLVALPLGIFSALNRNSLLDQIVRLLSLMGYCLPSYWFAILLILVFAVDYGVLPAGGYAPANEQLGENLKFAVLPTVTMAVVIASRMSRFVRASVLDVLRQDYLRTARAKGLRERSVLIRHALRNALIPIVTMLGLELGNSLSGLIVTEQIFTWPGLGWLSVQAVFQRDYELLQGTVLLSAVFYSVVNLLVDILVASLDPRITY